MILKFSVGLDASSKKVDSCISTIDFTQKVKVKSSCNIDNSKVGFAKLVQWIKKWTANQAVPVVVCMEATGVYHEHLAYYLDEAGFRVSIVLPNKSKKYLQSLGLKSKNDKMDAKGLAQMGAEQNLPKWTRPDEIYVQLRALTRQYQSIQEQITAEKNKLHAEEHSACSNKQVIRQIREFIRFMDKQKSVMEQAIKETVQKNEELKTKVKNISTVRGLSTLSIATVIAETNGFQLFINYKQLVSYAGYDVVENQSGARSGKTKISKKGNSRIRRILHMPSIIAKGSEGTVFKSLYDRVYQKTGIKMKAIVAVQKKLLLTIYYLWKKNEPFDKNYSKNQNENIQEEKLVPSSRHGSGRVKKSSQAKSLATQGKHPMSDHRLLPLDNCKNKKLILKN
jgi:transposase